MDIDGAAIITIIVRLVAPLLILRFPLFGTLLNAVLDGLDHEYIGKYDWYQPVDKILDTYYLGFSAYTALSWRDKPARAVAVGSYMFRLLGVVVMLITGTQEVLFLFPNFFENFFVFYLVFVRLTGQHMLLDSHFRAILVGTLLLVPKLFQEYSVHVYLPDRERAPEFVSTALEQSMSTPVMMLHVPALIVLGWWIVKSGYIPATLRRLVSRLGDKSP